jgi:hypothetical protein
MRSRLLSVLWDQLCGFHFFLLHAGGSDTNNKNWRIVSVVDKLVNLSYYIVCTSVQNEHMVSLGNCFSGNCVLTLLSLGFFNYLLEKDCSILACEISTKSNVCNLIGLGLIS